MIDKNTVPSAEDALEESIDNRTGRQEIDARVAAALAKARKAGLFRVDDIDCGRYYSQVCDELADLGYEAKFHDGKYVNVSWTEADIKWSRGEGLNYRLNKRKKKAG